MSYTLLGNQCMHSVRYIAVREEKNMVDEEPLVIEQEAINLMTTSCLGMRLERLLSEQTSTVVAVVFW